MSRDNQQSPATPSPWLLGRTEVEDVDPTTPRPRELAIPGRVGVFASRPSGDALPIAEHRPGGRHLLTLVGAHGGAGVTSLATGAETVAVLDRQWPNRELGWPSTVAVVCRSSAAGLDAGARLIREIAAGLVADVDLVALVVMADAPGRLPKALKLRAHELSGTVPVVLTVPWIEEWRQHPYTPHKATQTVVDQLVKLAERRPS